MACECSLHSGGSTGELLRDMEDYFYYAQIKLQGIASQTPYQVRAALKFTRGAGADGGCAGVHKGTARRPTRLDAGRRLLPQ